MQVDATAQNTAEKVAQYASHVRELEDRLLSDHGLMQQHVVEHAAKRVLDVVSSRHGRFDRLGDGDAEASWAARVLSQDLLAELGQLGRTRVNGRPPDAHHRRAIRLLVERCPHLEDLTLDVEDRAGIRQRGAPLPSSRLGDHLPGACLLVEERLGDRGVWLVRARRADALVLVVDVRRSPQGLLEPPRPEQGSRPPRAVHVDDLSRNVDVGLGRHLLFDESHRKQRSEVIRGRRLHRPRVEGRRRRRRQIRRHVVPARGDLRLVERDLAELRHTTLLVVSGKPTRWWLVAPRGVMARLPHARLARPIAWLPGR